MLNIHTHTDIGGVERYFMADYADYYEVTDDHKSPASWFGRTAQRLGLTGHVSRKHLAFLLRNIHPLTGARLTPRTKPGRRVATDVTLSAPKSVSLIAMLSDDPAIFKAFNRASSKVMQELERHIQSRVRKNGADHNRTTGNIIYLAVTHNTARPVNGIEEPHLHRHHLIMNVTWDPVEKTFKALQNETIFSNRAYYQALFDNHLAYELAKAGYQIERTEKSFEIRNIDKTLRDKFSSRTKVVHKKANALGITDPQIIGKLGAKTRESKTGRFSPSQLREIWGARLSLDEHRAIFNAKAGSSAFGSKITSHFKTAREKHPANAHKTSLYAKNASTAPAMNAIRKALSHVLERKSITGKLELLTQALYYAIGKASIEDLTHGLTRYDDLIARDMNGQTDYTTKTRLAEEQTLLDLITSGKNQYIPLAPTYRPQNDQLTVEQRKAIRHVLSAHHFVSVIIGDAGTGKTFTIREIARACEQQNIPIAALAPTASASRGVLRNEGFDKADTLSRFLRDKTLQQNVSNGLIWVDEAGLLSLPQTLQLLRIAKELNAKVLLTGDHKQHGSVIHTDMLRLITDVCSYDRARLTKVFRQQSRSYRKAVETIASGNINQAFNALQHMGSVFEHQTSDQAMMHAAKNYLSSDPDKTLLVSTTHRQGQRLTSLIRKYLKATGKISGRGRKKETLTPVDRTDTQKQDARTYRPGHIIEFHTGRESIKAGARFIVLGQDKNGLVIIRDAEGLTRTLPLHLSALYSVFDVKPIDLAIGDKIRITQNTRSREGIQVNNGAIFKFAGFEVDGALKLTDGNRTLTMDKDFMHLAHAYYTTSPSAQGRTVDKVIILANGTSGRAANKEQFYVSASRGKHEINVITDDAEGLKQAVNQSSHRMSAIEFLSLEM